MGAKSKLNYICALGSIVLAILAGAVTGSWIAFVLVLVFLLGLSLCTGDLRS